MGDQKETDSIPAIRSNLFNLKSYRDNPVTILTAFDNLFNFKYMQPRLDFNYQSSCLCLMRARVTVVGHLTRL